MNAFVLSARELCRGTTDALRLISRDNILSLVDQTVVSAANFVATLFIAHWSNADELGIYAVAMSILVSLQFFQDALILQPYLIRMHHQLGTTAERAGSCITFSMLFSGLSASLLALIGIGLLKWRVNHDIVAIIWATAAVLPLVLARDFSRRFLFTRLEFGKALWLDCAAAAAQLSALSWLGLSGHMSAINAAACLGAAAGLIGVIWLWVSWREFSVRLKHVRVAAKETWALGKWLLIARAIAQVQGSVIYWLAIAVAGPGATGVYAACMSIVGFANPLVLGLGNTFMPKLVLAWKSGGRQALWRESVRNTFLLSAVLGPFCIVILLGGGPIMQILYRGHEFAGQHALLAVLALSTLLGSLGIPASAALATMERPRLIAMIGTTGAAFTVAFAWLLMREFGLLGTAYALLTGTALSTLARWLTFYLGIRDTLQPRLPAKLRGST